MNDLVKISWQPDLRSSSLIVVWNGNIGSVASNVSNYLCRKLGGRSFAEIEPVDFFRVGGVTVENDIVQFPESTFHVCPGSDLVIFQSPPPANEWYKFLTLVLDVAREHCHVREVYMVSTMVSLATHTAPRALMATFSSRETKQSLSHYGLSGNWDYETPEGGARPTISSFLLWTAKRKQIPAISLWVVSPFYLMGADDPRGRKRVLEFFNQRFHLQLDLSDLDIEIERQDEKLAQARQSSPDIDEAIRKLEGNIRLSAEESQKLVTEIEKFFKG